MSRKQEKQDTKNARLNKLDQTLEKMLSEYEIDDYERRHNSHGSDRLYIHLKRIVKPVQLAVK